MQEKKALPFLTRTMLSFESGMAFSLRITTQSDVAGTLTIRGMTSEGIFTLKHTTTDDGIAATSTYRIPDIPIMVTVLDGTSTYEQGQCFVSLSIVANEDILYQLTSGFVYRQKALSFPKAEGQNIRTDEGSIEYNQSDDPAAGAQASIMVPTTEYWKILSVVVTLVTDATVANRLMQITFGTSGGNVTTIISATAQTASQTILYNALQNGRNSISSISSVAELPLPNETWVPGGKSIATNVFGLQAGDNVGVIKLLVKKFYKGTNP